MTSASTPVQQPSFVKNGVHRRNMLAGGASLLALTAMTTRDAAAQQPAQSPQLQAGVSGRKPNILVIFGDDIGQTNISAYSFGLMGDRTPNIDRIVREGTQLQFRERVLTVVWTQDLAATAGMPS